MLVNMIQRDMKSNNQLEVCAALAAVNKIVTVDMIPAVIGDVRLSTRTHVLNHVLVHPSAPLYHELLHTPSTYPNVNLRR